MGGKHPQKKYLLSALSEHGEEVPTDLGMPQQPLRQRFLLRDFITTGDVVRIQLPYLELAALIGLADAVVDVVQTGATLRAAGLVEVLAQSTARLIVNRQALKLKRALPKPIIARLRQP